MPRVVLLVGTRKGAYLLESNDGRTSWSVRGPVLKGWRVADMMVDPRVDDRMLAAVSHFVYGPTIHASTDMGESWTQVEGSPAFAEDDDRELEEIWSIIPGTDANPDTLYAGVADAGLFVSRDGGDNWTELRGLADHETSDRWFPGNGGLCLHSILVDPDDPDRLWVGISAVGVFRSTDGGESWSLQNEGLARVGETGDEESTLGSCVHRLVHDPANADHLYQQNHMGVFRSRDGAERWDRIDEGLPSTFGFPMVMHPRDPETLYTFPLESDEYRFAQDGRPAVYRTRDAGDSWHRLDEGLPSDSWVTVLRQAMATDSLEPAGVYAGTTGGELYHSRDAGETWTTIDCALPRIFSVDAVVVEDDV